MEKSTVACALDYRSIGERVNQVTILRWIKKYSKLVKEFVVTLTPQLSGLWHENETMLSCEGRNVWFWEMIDEDTKFLVASHVSGTRTLEDTIAVFRKGFEQSKVRPRAVFVDGSFVYETAFKSLLYNAKGHKTRISAKSRNATSMFEGIGFAVSILSITIVFIGQRLIFVLLLFPVFHFIIAGMCSWNATRVARYHFFTTSQDLENDLALTAGKPLEERRRYWIAQKLASTEMNSKLLLVKSNWLSAAYQHFVLGLLFIIPILAAMVYEIAQGLMYTDC